jgi:hypothetical protein
MEAEKHFGEDEYARLTEKEAFDELHDLYIKREKLIGRVNSLVSDVTDDDRRSVTEPSVSTGFSPTDRGFIEKTHIELDDVDRRIAILRQKLGLEF